MTSTQLSYKEMLRSPLWQKKKNSILIRDHYACTCCGDIETNLQVHHIKYTGFPWDAADEDLKTLCEHCHYIHTRLHSILPKTIIHKIFKIKGGNNRFTAFVFTEDCIRVFSHDNAILLQTFVLESNPARQFMHALIDYYINDDGNNNY